MARGNRKKQFLINNPFCIYCGGVEAAKTWDHMPNKGMFPKDRPGGLEFPSCEACNQGSKWFEDVASFVGSIRFQNTDRSIEHFTRKMEHLKVNHPEILDEFRPTNRQLRRVRNLSVDDTWESAGVLNLQGELVSKAMLLYGAKLGLALHWGKTKQALSRNEKLGVIWYSNANAFDGNVPQDLFKMLPDKHTLSEGRKVSEHPFLYASGQVPETGATAHWAIFGNAIVYFLFAGGSLNLSLLPKANVFSPGCLQTTKPTPAYTVVPWPQRQID